MSKEKIGKISDGLREKIVFGERNFKPDEGTPVTNYLVNHMRHCNGGKTVDAGLWLRKHCDDGGKIFLSMSGAGSTFQQGTHISELIRAGKIAGISVTGANLEESVYRLYANSHYAYIPDYTELTRPQEKELDDAGLRRITDTFLPEEESVRILLPEFEKNWREAEESGQSFFWHEYFFKLFENKSLTFDETANPDDCWLLQAYLHKIPIFVGGVEDSTMGNIFAYYAYDGKHKFLSNYKQGSPINPNVVKHSFRYMHSLAEFYMNNTKDISMAFLQYGGGIAGDFPICVVPHLKKDFMEGCTNEEQEKMIRSWAGFVEINTSAMSLGSYTGAGYKEKITWGKFNINAFGMQIYGDYTAIAPLLAAIILRK